MRKSGTFCEFAESHTMVAHEVCYENAGKCQVLTDGGEDRKYKAWNRSLLCNSGR